MSAKLSPPRPFMVGSTTVSVIAVAKAASTALPPFCKASIPACVANGCELATAFFARTGARPPPKGGEINMDLIYSIRRGEQEK